MNEARAIEIAREALRHPPEARAAFLEGMCDSEALRREVEALLAADAAAEAEGFLNDPALDLHALLSSLRGVAPASDEVPVGRSIGPYVVERRLGVGGMGVVYAARDMRLGRRVALKLLPATRRADADAKARFVREARTASALDDPNICTIYEVGETEDGQLYTAMAYYGGQTLAGRLAGGPLPVEEAHDILEQVARGLSRAHAAGITHRDVKPANVMLVDGVVKILDFGVAKLEGQGDLTGDGRLVGTVAYMAPEQARGEPVDERTDVWALGVMAYEMLTGVHPFRKATPVATLHALQYEAPAPPRALRADVPAALERVVLQMIAKSPADRCPSMKAVRAALDEALPPGAAGVSGATPPGYSAWWGMGGAGILLALLLTLVGPFDPERASSDLRSVAVLPLVSHASDSALVPFAEGMTDALIADLGQIEDLRVISRTSVQAYRGAGKPLPEIAEELGVAAIVEGAVQAGDGEVGITVQLVDATADRILWAESYERPLRDVVSLQHEVALAIARQVEASITPQAEVHLAATPEVDPEAYEHYLWGLHHRNRETPDSWREAVRQLDRAIAADSAFAPAHALLARVLVQTAELPLRERARRAAERALALDPTLSDAHVSLGLYHELVEWNGPAAEHAFRQALQQAPGDAEAHHELGQLLMRQRRFQEALPFVQQALYLDPLSGRMVNGVADVYLFSGQYERALDLLQQSLALDSSNAATYWRLGQAYQGLGRHDEAIAAFETMVDLGGMQAMGHLGHALAVAGRRDEAMAFLDDMMAPAGEAGAPDAPWRAYNAALVNTGLGAYDEALGWLERACAERSVLLVYLDVVPAFAPLRDAPRFRALLHEVGLDRGARS